MVKFKRNTIGKVFVVYECPNCDASLRSPVEEVGKMVKCLRCKENFNVPGLEELEESIRKRLRSKVPSQNVETLREVSSFHLINDTKKKVANLDDHKRRMVIFTLLMVLTPVLLVASFITFYMMMIGSNNDSLSEVQKDSINRLVPNALIKKEAPNPKISKDNIEILVIKDGKRISIYDYLDNLPNDIVIKDTDSDVLKKAKSVKQIGVKNDLLNKIDELYLVFTFKDTYVKDAFFIRDDKFYSISLEIPNTYREVCFRTPFLNKVSRDNIVSFANSGTPVINQEHPFYLRLHVSTDFYEKSFKDGKRIEVKIAKHSMGPDLILALYVGNYSCLLYVQPDDLEISIIE